MAGASSDLAVVVLAVAAPARLIDAVRSLAAQTIPLEIVVVNSGGGDAARLLRSAGIHVPVANSDALLTPGAARNRGITATRAPYVAFLAEDCLATPGWAEARMIAHRAGAAAVASALVNDQPRNPIAWAGHLSLFARRLPGTPTHAALTYGASYARELFDRYGAFREDMRTGEDTEFHLRLAPTDKPIWVPSVQTIHRSPRDLPALLRDHWMRGQLTVRAQRQLNPISKRKIAINVLKRTMPTIGSAFRWLRSGQRIYVVLASPFMLLATGAYICGVLTADPAAYK